MLNRFGLRTRLVLLVFLAVLPGLGFSISSAVKSRQAVLAQAQTHLQLQAQNAALLQQRLVDRLAQLLDNMASGPAIIDTRNRLCVQHLQNLQLQHPDYLNMGVVGLDGKVSCHALGASDQLEVGDRPFFTQVIAGKDFATGGYSAGRGSKHPGITFGKPVRESDGTINGVAFASVDIAAISRALTTNPMEAGSELRVLDKNGIVLASRPANALLLGSAEQDSVVRDAARVGGAGVREAIDAEGVNRLYAYAPVDGAARGHFFVAISVPRDLVSAGPDAQFRRDLALLGLLTTFALFWVWWMSQRLIVSPAQAILTQASEVTIGNLTARVSPKLLGQDEIGQISQAFNRMAESLQVRQAALDAALQQADEERALLQRVLNSMGECVMAIDVHERFLLRNSKACQTYTGVTEPGGAFLEWRNGHTLMPLDSEIPCNPLHDPLLQALRGASLDNWVRRLRRAGQSDRIMRFNARPLRDVNGQLFGAVAVISDITERKAAEDFAASQQQVLALVAAGVPLRQSLESIVHLVEQSVAGSLCSILLVRDKQLCFGAAPHLPDELIQAFDGLTVGESAGASAASVFRKLPVRVGDVMLDPVAQPFRNLLQTHGLQACWATPVVSATGEVLATLTLYRRNTGLPQPRDEELMATASDLTRIALERASAESALVVSEARFLELAENIDDVFYSVDARTLQVLYVSPAYQKIWGHTCQSLYADPGSYARALVAEDRPMLALAYQRNRAGQTSEIEYRIVTPEGNTRWISHRSYPVFNAAGEMERVVGMALDISARKQAARVLSRSNRALQMLSRSSVAINRTDDEASLLAEVCQVAVELGGYRLAWVGYAQEDAYGSIQVMAQAGDDRGYLDILSVSWRGDSNHGQGPVGRAIRNGRAEQTSNISTAGDFLWRDAALQRGYRSCLALPLSAGKRCFGVLCLYAAAADDFLPDEISLLQELADNVAFGIGSLRARQERDRSQQAERQGVVQLREQASLMDQAQDAIMVRNLDGTLRFWNKGAERLFGWTAKEVLGHTMYAQMYRDVDAVIRVKDQILASKQLWTGETETLARDGSVVEVEARWSVMRDEQGRVNGMLGINTDIRERKQARENILHLNASLEERVNQRTAQLELANQQLEAFSYSVSHDLRSPLGVIAGFSTLLGKSLAKSAADPHTERSRHYLSRIRTGVVQMGELIDAMLVLAQVSRATMRWEAVDLSALSLELLDGYQAREPSRAVRISVEPGLQAKGDPRLLRQVLDNLLGNAWKFAGNKAVAEIAVGQQTGHAGETVYFVRDNGDGFDMAYAEKLFGVFQRLHSASEFGGHGVGLAMVQRIVERHSGKIWGESALGSGASFYFTLGKAAP